MDKLMNGTNPHDAIQPEGSGVKMLLKVLSQLNGW